MLRNTIARVVVSIAVLPGARGEPVPTAEHTVTAAIATNRLVPGAPYELAGKRLVFANWYYI
jgi:hypothetical protein